MYGAILGDIIGSPYEFDRSGKTKDFPLFSPESRFTDDSVMTLAVADALLDIRPGDSDDAIRQRVIQKLQHWGRTYIHAGYGAKFTQWLLSDAPQPCNSWGNGSAMRVSAAAWLFDDLSTVRRIARLTADVSHNHPEGIKGAEATASAICLARTGHTRQHIRQYIETAFGYDLSRSCDEIRPHYHHVASCQQTVPEAITAFLEGDSFEDVIRTAVSLGGDCDTLTCIAGSMAEAFYGVPQPLKETCLEYLPGELRGILLRFEASVSK